MYSMVLMMAVAGSGDAAGFGGKNKGCGGCHGEVVVMAPAGCSGASCSGGGLFHREKKSCGGGFLGGMRGKHSCHGAQVECCPVPAPAPVCGGCDVMPVPAPMAVPAAPPAKEMPKPETKKEAEKKST